MKISINSLPVGLVKTLHNKTQWEGKKKTARKEYQLARYCNKEQSESHGCVQSRTLNKAMVTLLPLLYIIHIR